MGTTIVPPWAQLSPIRDIGIPPAKAVGEPSTTLSGGPTQTATQPGPIAGIPPIRTVGIDGDDTGPPTCGIPGGVTWGQTCIADIVAAGVGTMLPLSSLKPLYTELRQWKLLANQEKAISRFSIPSTSFVSQFAQHLRRAERQIQTQRERS